MVGVGLGPGTCVRLDGQRTREPGGLPRQAAANCAEFHESSLPTARNIVFDHLPVSDCGTGQTGCTGYAQWQADWRRLTGEAAPAS